MVRRKLGNALRSIRVEGGEVRSMSNDKINLYMELVRKLYPHRAKPVVENALSCQPDVDVARAGFFKMVVNEPGTGEEKSPAGSWKAFWMKDGRPLGDDVNVWPTRCSVCGCSCPADHGAHVRDVRSGELYIVPMCARENNPHNHKLMLLRMDVAMVKVPEGEGK